MSQSALVMHALFGRNHLAASESHPLCISWSAEAYGRADLLTGRGHEALPGGCPHSMSATKLVDTLKMYTRETRNEDKWTERFSSWGEAYEDESRRAKAGSSIEPVIVAQFVYLYSLSVVRRRIRHRLCHYQWL